MGMNTYLSLPRKLLNRKYVVLTHRECELDDDIIVCHNIDELLTYIGGLDTEVMVIGGASIYKQMIGYANKMLLTEIDDSKNADVYFPIFNKDDWDSSILCEHEYNGLTYKHVKYVRKR